MKVRALWLVMLAMLLVASRHAQAQADQTLPELTGVVNDFAHVIDAPSRQALERLSGQLQAASGDVVVIATVATVQPYGDIHEYAVKLFENHGRGIGERSKDNGLLVLLALNERRVTVEVGYGLEGFVTDGFAGEVSRGMTPYFREQRYGEGLLAGTTRLVARIAQGRNVTLTGVEPEPPSAGDRSGGSWPTLIVFVIVLLVVARLNRRGPRGPRYWGNDTWSGWSSGVGPFGGGHIGGGFGGGFGGFGGGRSGGGGGGASW